MDNYIGDNIKNLRRQKDVTQEELAKYLNVSFQSISKWERGENLPDINILAALSNFFDVSTDELLGMDKQKSSIFCNDFYIAVNRLISEEKYDEAVNKLRSAQKVYPNNTGINSSLAMVLALRDKSSDRDEAIGLYQRILGGLQDEKVKTSARTAFFIITKNAMTHEKALAQAKRLTHIWECREMITAELHSGNERVQYLKGLILRAISLLYYKIQNGPLNDTALLKMIFLGPPDIEDNQEINLKMLEAIKDFIIGTTS
jgi:transcriptional regulator with XRE-family HTH domain